MRMLDRTEAVSIHGTSRKLRLEKYLNGLGQGEHMVQLFNALLQDESGQDLAEYAILIGLIALAVIVAVRLLGGTISGIFNNIGTELNSAGIPTTGGGS